MIIQAKVTADAYEIGIVHRMGVTLPDTTQYAADRGAIIETTGRVIMACIDQARAIGVDVRNGYSIVVTFEGN